LRYVPRRSTSWGSATPGRVLHVGQVAPVDVGASGGDEEDGSLGQGAQDEVAGRLAGLGVELGSVDAAQAQAGDGAQTEAEVDGDAEGVTVDDLAHAGGVGPDGRLVAADDGARALGVVVEGDEVAGSAPSKPDRSRGTQSLSKPKSMAGRRPPRGAAITR
jgi:hypothetical protein